MKVSELIKKLEKLKETHGDIGVYKGDMGAPKFEVWDAECPEEYGDKYIMVNAD